MKQNFFKIQVRCGCGARIRTIDDWLSHWKYDGKYHDGTFLGDHPKLRAIKQMLLTRIERKV